MLAVSYTVDHGGLGRQAVAQEGAVEQRVGAERVDAAEAVAGGGIQGGAEHAEVLDARRAAVRGVVRTERGLGAAR